VREETDRFSNAIVEQRGLKAWYCLKRIHTWCAGLDSEALRTFTHRPSPETLTAFRAICVNNWAKHLKPLAGEHNKSRLPGPFEMMQLLVDIGWYNSTSWSGVLWGVSMVLVQYREMHPDGDPRQLLAGIRELVGLWQLVLKHQETRLGESSGKRGDPPRGDGAQDRLWSLLPSSEALDTVSRDVHGENSLNRVLWTAFPRPNRDDQPDDGLKIVFDYASPALATIDLLRAPPISARDGVEHDDLLSQEYQPLLDFLEEAVRLQSPVAAPPRLLRKLDPDRGGASFFLPLVQRLKVAVDPEVVNQLQEKRDEQQRHLSEAVRQDPRTSGVTADDSAELAGVNKIVFDVQPTPEMHDFAQSCISRLVRARQQNNYQLAQLVNNEVMDMAAENAKVGKPPPPLELYEHLMQAFLLLAHPEKAMFVWETMIRTGFLPTVRTYTVMLRGARASRDATGMQVFWARMRNAGIQPDTPAWTAYIHGLIKLRRVDQGLEAVKEMGREWLAAAKEQSALDQRAAGGVGASSRPLSTASLLAAYPSSVRGVPRPDTSVINSAITALADTRDRAIPEVVSWARVFNIEFDIITYNTLINFAMRKHETKSALALLAHMQERGVAPNGDTWVVLLAAMFQNGFLDHVDRDKQLDKVLAWLESTRSADGKVTVDEKGFALIIDRFVKHLNNPDAASGILSYMAENGQKFSVYMATIILTSYFDEDPPNFKAIDALWQRLTNAQLNEGLTLRINGPIGSVDTVFYDRLIEGYARYHYLIGLKPCLEALKRCVREGRKPGWRAQEQVARAMVAKDRYDLLRDMVTEVRARLRQGRGATQMQGQRDFWEFVISTGILEHEGIRRPEDLLPKDGRRTTPMAESLPGEEEMV
jgi:pentatricopeptide repeat protein